MVSVWPAWEVWEGGVATAWFQVRLAFADGAAVDGLAVVADGNVSLEDVRARPALSLDDLAVLADWIEVPLFEACGIATAAAEDRGTVPGEDRRTAADEPEATAEDAVVGGRVVGEGAADGGAVDGDAVDGDAADEVTAEGCTSDGGEGADASGAAGAAGPRRARPSWPRGIEGRWLVAQEYRAAQEEGTDPVLAVMCATGHSRRRSLRLIAQARDAGFLAPRHARRS